MATTKGSDNRFPLVRLTYEDDTPATPPADEGHIVAGVDKVLRWIDDDGTVTELGAGASTTVATDAIWDAAGDLAVGSGANTAARLAAGSEDDVLTIVSGVPAWAAPAAPGGGGWDLAIDEDGSSFANFTSISGTWASTGTIIQQTSGSGERSAYHSTIVPPGLVLLQVDVRWPTGSSANNQIGLFVGTTTSPDIAVAFRRALTDTNVNRVGTALLGAITSPTAKGDDTWYTLRVLFTGYGVSCWEDGTFFGSLMNLSRDANIQRNHVGLFTADNAADMRNFKVWTPTLPA